MSPECLEFVILLPQRPNNWDYNEAQLTDVKVQLLHDGRKVLSYILDLV